MYIRFFLFFDNTFMRRKNHKAAFTLAELLVTISIITILALGISNVNFARLSQNQQVSIEAIKISNLIEEARNNALIGKGIWENLITPESWSVSIENSSSSGSLQVTYFSWSSISYDQWSAPFPFTISNLECQRLNGSTDARSGPLIITFTGSLGWVSGCSDNTYKKIKFDYWVWNLSQSITINSLSWVIEID